MARPSLESLLGGSKPTQRPSLESLLGSRDQQQPTLTQDRSFALQQAGLNPEAISKAYGSQVSDMPAQDFQNFVSELSGIKGEGTERERKSESMERRTGRLRAFGQGATLGLADEGEALVTGRDVSDIRGEQEQFTKEHPGQALALDVAGGLVTGGLAAKGLNLAKKSTLLGKVGQGAKIGAVAGAFEGSTRGEGLEGRIKGAKIGGTIGAATGGIIPAIGAGIKAARPTKKIISEQAGDVIKSAKSGNFEDLVLSNKGKRAFNNAIKSGDEGIATQIQSVADDKIMQTPQRVSSKIDNILGAGDIAKKNQALKTDFGNFMQKRGGEQIKSQKLADVLETDSFKRAYKDVIGDNVSLRNKPVNSIEVLQEVKSTLGNWGRTGDKGANKFGKRSKEIKEAIDSSFSGFKELNTKYAKMKQLEDSIEKLKTLKSGKTSRGLFFDQDVKNSIVDNFGEKKYNKLFNSLKEETTLQNRLSKLSSRAEQEITKADPLLGERMREALESPGAAAGAVADKLTMSKGRHIRKGIADVLLGNQQYTPVKKVIKRPQDLTTSLLIGTQPLQEAR